jgi:hypothetical protein
MSLFNKLFTEFNCRYDKMNARLRQIAISGEPLDEADRQAIVDYYNLCGEEYLFFAEGYIQRRVWRSWCSGGMLTYFENEPFRSIWEEEKATDLVLRIVSRCHSRGSGLIRSDRR